MNNIEQIEKDIYKYTMGRNKVECAYIKECNYSKEKGFCISCINYKASIKELSTALHKAGYRPQSEVVKEFAEKLNEKIQLKRDLKEDFMRPNTIKALEFWANEWRNKCIDISKFIKEIAKEYGKEVL